MTKKLISILAIATCIFALPATAGHHEETDSVFKEAFLKNFDDANDKVVALAEAFTEEQYSWSPVEGVRSVKDSILHVAGANYFLATRVGATMPEGLNPWTLEADIHTKQETLETLKHSIEFVRNAIEASTAKELEESIDLFGNEAPRMAAVLIIGGHAHEHLGQLIAYARSNGVTPPWSQ